jgi:hypothetical protein
MQKSDKRGDPAKFSNKRIASQPFPNWAAAPLIGRGSLLSLISLHHLSADNQPF